jgi:diguanylate cyclase (GGDEF)-like protein
MQRQQAYDGVNNRESGLYCAAWFQSRRSWYSAPISLIVEVLRQAGQKLPLGIVIADEKQRILFSNEQALQLIRQVEFAALFAFREGVWTPLTSTRNERHVECARITLQLGRPWHIFLFHDLTRWSRRIEKLEQLCMTDDLTKLYNRRGFLVIANHLVQSARREGRQLHLIFADLDGLKSINDSFGHQLGDQAILDFSNVLRNALRASDVVGRIGGDEFVILTSASDDQATIARLQSELSEFNQRTERPYKVSASFGVSAIEPDESIVLDEILIRADKAMYEQKRRKKDNARSRCAGQESIIPNSIADFWLPRKNKESGSQAKVRDGSAA